MSQQLLSGVAVEAQRSILAESRRQMFEPAQVLFRMGEEAEHLFVLNSGRVQFSRLASSGREVVLGILTPGDVFGLGSLSAARFNYIGTAEALEAGEALVWRRDVIHRLADEHPQIASNALQVALRYVATFTERHEQLVTSTAEQRLVRALSHLGTQAGTHSRSGIEVRVKNEQLASLADISPFTASRILQSLQRSGVISKQRGRVQILFPEKLLRD